MRYLFLVALAAAAFAQDKPAEKKPEKPKRTPLERGEWEYLVRTILENGQTTVKRLEALRIAAEKHIIVERAKITDVRPAPSYGKGAVEVVLWSARQLTTGAFLISAEHAAVAKGWAKWDRVSWRSVPHVHDLERITLTPIFRTVADLKRTPNPGIEPAPHQKCKHSYGQWLRQYRRTRRYRDKWQSLQTYANEAFPSKYAVTVVDRHVDGVTVRLEDGRCFRLPIEDPQTLEAAYVGRSVVLAIYVRPDASDYRSFCAQDGAIRWEFHFWHFAAPDK